jgi:hypothetical protein
MSSLLSYHIFLFFISNFFENFKFGRNFSKFIASLCYRLLPVKIGGNHRLPIVRKTLAPAPTREIHRITKGARRLQQVPGAPAVARSASPAAASRERASERAPDACTGKQAETGRNS